MSDLIKVLVIDDSETNTLLIKSMFEETKRYSVSTLLDSTKTIKTMEKEEPDVVLLDLMMPKMDGFEVLTVLKNHENLKNIPIIVVSALDQDNDIDRAMKLGAAEYVVKPIGKNQLFEKVERYLVK